MESRGPKYFDGTLASCQIHGHLRTVCRVPGGEPHKYASPVEGEHRLAAQAKGDHYVAEESLMAKHKCSANETQSRSNGWVFAVFRCMLEGYRHCRPVWFVQKTASAANTCPSCTLHNFLWMSR